MKIRLLSIVLASLAFVLVHDPSRAQGVTIDDKGWTVVKPSPDTILIYVSPDGKDSNPGTSEAAPKKTPAAGASALRDRSADRLRLKSGATFPDGFGRWTKSGRSASEPLVVEVYGGLDRAKIRTPASKDPLFFDGGDGAPPRFDHVVFQSLDFEPVGRTGTEEVAGVRILRPVNDILFEDCRWAGFNGGLVLQGADGPLTDIRLRRCQVLDSWNSISAHAGGIYTEKLSGLYLFECLVDHCGYDGPSSDTGADVFQHNLYLQNDQGPATLENCVISRASSHGAQLRSGGTVKACIFTQNSIGLSVGGGNTPNAGGVPVDIRESLFLDGKDISASEKRGWGLCLSNIAGGHVTDNLFAHSKGGQPQVLSLEKAGTFGIEGLTLARNVAHDWPGGLIGAGNDYVRGLVQEGNDWNRATSACVDPTNNLPSGYLESLRAQSRANWNRSLWPPGEVSRGILAGYARN